jgi:hypothetical protein
LRKLRRVFPENLMPDHDLLSNLVLAHWSRHHPLKIERLRQEKLLEQALHEITEQMSDRLYDLVSVHKMQHHQAWELVIQEFLSPEESSSTLSPNQSPPATSG